MTGEPVKHLGCGGYIWKNCVGRNAYGGYVDKHGDLGDIEYEEQYEIINFYFSCGKCEKSWDFFDDVEKEVAGK